MITGFRGAHWFLSNFSPAPVTFDGYPYPTVEHAYQAAKTLDPSIRKHIRVADSPGESKRRGRQAPLRVDWEEIKLDVMLGLLRQKFTDTHYRLMLLETEYQNLVEGNDWRDTFWGVCRGEGENHLGKLLMQVREEVSDDLTGGAKGGDGR